MDTEPRGQPEDEYHFTEHEEVEDFATASAPQPPEKPPRGGGLKNRKILLFIGLIALAFALYKLLDILFTSRSTRTATKVATKPVNMPIVPEIQPKPIAPPPAVVEQPLPPSAQAANQATIDNLNKQVADLQNTLTALDSRLSDLTNTVNNIGNKAPPPVEVAPVLEEAAPKRKRIGICGCGKARVARPIPIFYVKAMVQGRAWLLAGNGHIVTVAIGDQLPGYGIVRTIDTYEGTILMSSGAIIGYSPDDS